MVFLHHPANDTVGSAIDPCAGIGRRDGCAGIYRIRGIPRRRQKVGHIRATRRRDQSCLDTGGGADLHALGRSQKRHTGKTPALLIGLGIGVQLDAALFLDRRLRFRERIGRRRFAGWLDGVFGLPRQQDRERQDHQHKRGNGDC